MQNESLPELYGKVSFPVLPDRPYFYSNFVQTIDGKVATEPWNPEYWPLGSRTDFHSLLNLRANADLLVHGSATALLSPAATILKSAAFAERRAAAGKPAPLPYAVVSGHPSTELADRLSQADPAWLVTTESADLPDNLASHVRVVRADKETASLTKAAMAWKAAGFDAVLVEGGPRLFSSFVAEGLIDEVFVTIAPALLTGSRSTTLNMTEGALLPFSALPRFSLVTNEAIGNEVFLRYQRTLS